MTAVPVKLPTPQKILPGHMLTGEFARNVWCINPLEGMTPEDLLKAETYVHVSSKLKQNDILEVVAPDGSWWAELLVRSAIGAEIETGMLRLVKFDEVEGQSDLPYYPKYSGNKSSKWRVLRRGDNHIMIEGLDSKLACLKWVEETFGPAKAPEQVAA